MYLKIVTDNETHYIKCGGEVSVKQGDLLGTFPPECGIHLMCEDKAGRTITLFPDLQTDEIGVLPRTVVTDGKVYLLDDSGKTVDVIQR